MLNKNYQEYVRLAEDILQTFSKQNSFKEVFDVIQEEKMMREFSDQDHYNF